MQSAVMESTASIIDQLEDIYEQSACNLSKCIEAYIADRTPPDPEWRARGAFAYPELQIRYAGGQARGPVTRAFARLSGPGVYASSIARPGMFRAYLTEQLEHLSRDYEIEFSVGRSASEIPYPYVIERSGLDIADISAAQLSKVFPSTELTNIGDEVADGVWISSDVRPLALFDGPRTDFSLARLQHYTGTRPEHFQRFILFTNYVRYVDELSASPGSERRGGSIDNFAFPSRVDRLDHFSSRQSTRLVEE